MTDPRRLERVLPWLLRAAWIGVLVAGGTALDEGGVGSDAHTYCAFGVWFATVCAMAVPAVVSLTATRVLVPLSVPVAVLVMASGDDLATGIAFLATAVVATVLAFSAIVGRAFVQASAYGEEDRHPLKPPAAYGLATAVTWSLWTAVSISAAMQLTDRRWLVGAPLAVLALGGLALGWPRWHRLARRWLVIVPIGLVVHDQLVLAETIMLRRQEIAGLRLAPAGTEAADLTGPASGHAIEIETAEPVTAILAATPGQPRGTAIHLRTCLVAPSRPGQALRAAAARRLPVG